MKSKLIFLFLLLCTMFAVKELFAAKKDCKTLTHGSDIYKHFVGTIGKRKVVLDLRFGYCGGSNYGGSYYYEVGSKDAKLLIIGEPEKFEYDAPLQATEYQIDDNWIEVESTNGYRPIRWQFTIKDDHLTGKWYSADKKEILDINMVEDYGGAYPMEILVYRDSAKKYLEAKKIKATYNFIGVKPSAQISKPDADFINSELLQFTGGNKIGASTFQDVPNAQSQKSFDEFRKNCQLLITDTPVVNMPNEGSDCFALLFPVFNGDGFLTMDYEQFSYTMNGMNKSHTYNCIDVSRKKVWHLNDIIADKAELTKLLQDEYKNRLKPEARVRAAVDKIAPTENIILTHNGLVFCYPSNDNLHIVDEIRIFVSFNKLKGSLTQDFRSRMNL